MKLYSIYIEPLENGYTIKISFEDPKAKENYSTIDKVYYCATKEDIINHIVNIGKVIK